MSNRKQLILISTYIKCNFSVRKRGKYNLIKDVVKDDSKKFQALNPLSYFVVVVVVIEEKYLCLVSESEKIIN